MNKLRTPLGLEVCKIGKLAGGGIIPNEWTIRGADGKYLCSLTKSLAEQFVRAVNNCAKYEEALRFYANKDNYNDDGAPGNLVYEDDWEVVRLLDDGLIAQQAIAEAEPEDAVFVGGPDDIEEEG